MSDLVDGLIKLQNSNYSLPVNLGNPDEHTIEGEYGPGDVNTYLLCNFLIGYF